MKKTQKTKTSFSDDQLRVVGKLILLMRHVRNCHELGPHPLRAEAVAAEGHLEKMFGGEIPQRAYDFAFGE